ncbi:zinc-binding dehydrogenase [Saccharopolyspora gloriosae]|uniref:S-(Hydroxymethyl)glutathione dehydrogenase/alcohol dehydrogenase n=1 Tax=Saccharopolyspora gloriosae TaxID=455344 RepID=A0A840NGW3_9PSEU|nr:zinc-binding dehydrogenase [Saccharopolyspora gloriosae]MBB5070261.1 S-(hydroxymethyl)glutathione dehydrogenase/alcohol dehydrogenase [Saccharopolyspora gloriosae]
MQTMTAAVWSGPTEPLRLEEIARPSPRRGEALVRVVACGVCHTDLHVMKGEVGFPAPAVLGHEISGHVVEAGPDTELPAGVEIGGAVVGAFIMPCGECAACRAGRDDLCGPFFAQNRGKGRLFDGTTRLRGRDGADLAMYSMAGLAEYCVVPVTALVALPDSVPAAQAAILGCAAFTAHGAVANAGGVAEGEAVAVVAVGGVGSSIVQLAKSHGASPVIAVDVDDAKLAAVRDLGADHVVNSTTEDAVAKVRELTGGAGVSAVFEALGLPQTFEQSVRMLADGGRMVAVGIGSGAASAQVEITPLVRRGLRIIGSFGARTREALPAVVAEAVGGALSLERTVTRTYPLERVNEAFDDLAGGRIPGRAVITMDASHS